MADMLKSMLTAVMIVSFGTLFYVYVHTRMSRYIVGAILSMFMVGAYTWDVVWEEHPMDGLVVIRVVAVVWSIHMAILQPLLTLRSIRRIIRRIEDYHADIDRSVSEHHGQ